MSSIITENIDNIPVKEKQLVFDTSANRIYLDKDSRRIPMSAPEYAGLQVISVDNAADCAVTLDPGTRYELANAVSSLDVSFSDADSALETEMTFTTTEADFGSISFPATLLWVGEPQFEGGKSYIVSVCNNVAVAADYAALEA